jgi:FKBP-type peptidyl-prolyl cis-trans isomerase FklB
MSGLLIFLSMKKILFLLLTAFTVITVHAQPGTSPAPKPAVKPATKAPVKNPVFKTMLDSVSYVIGLNVATFYKQQGTTRLNSAIVSRGIADVLQNKKALFDDAAANTLMYRYMNTLQEKKAAATIKEGQAFLAQNKKKPGVKTTASGLQYEILKDATGLKPAAIDTFVCHYKGTLLNGTEFENSYNRGEPLVYPVGRVIAGWTEGLQLMSIGSKYKFYIPYQLGYGVYGNEPTIPGGAMLIFEMELLDIKKTKPTDIQKNL